MATTGGSPVLVDTNVLVYLNRQTSPYHARAEAALLRLRDEGRALWVFPQVIREYLAAVTRPQLEHAATPLPEALSDVRRIARMFNMAEEGSPTVARLLDLLVGRRVGGKQVHDAHLVATMLVNGITSLLTFNARDFERFTDVIRLELP